MNRFIKALHIISWVLIGSVKLGLAILGLFVVPFALIPKDWPRWAWVWGNNEEGVPDWWMNGVLFDNIIARYFPRWWWYAIRNPVNNSRFIFKDRDAALETNWTTGSQPMEPQKMIDVGVVMAYRWAWNGPFAGYRKVWLNDAKNWSLVSREPTPTHYSELWFGWKLGSDVPGLGFTAQVRLKREIGK